MNQRFDVLLVAVIAIASLSGEVLGARRSSGGS
jgi:hypothetical protein